MANRKSSIEQSDVTFWGIGALAFGGLAVLSATLGAVLPQSLWVGLHANRLEGGNLNQLRAEVSRLHDQQVQLRRQASQLRSRLVTSERKRGDMVQRVGALESSIPMLLEVVPPGTEIDRSALTASISEPENDTISFEAEGGTVTLTRRPLFESAEPEVSSAQPLPQPLSVAPAPVQFPEAGQGAEGELVAAAPTDRGQINALTEPAFKGTANLMQTEFGIAIGEAVTLESADEKWSELSGKIGTLLLGLNPAVSDPLGDGSKHIVLGPIADYAEAEMLCLRIGRVGIDCLPVQYENSRRLGTP
ncbi:MAG TPA: hypothetical protein ENJ90_05755 [Devosia sp.]|nr:hypothetical protein [Devosia sp.]